LEEAEQLDVSVSAATRCALVLCCGLLVAGDRVARAQEASAPAAPGSGSKAAVPSPGLNFDYRTSSRYSPPRALIDIAIRSTSPDSEATLWIAPHGSTLGPDADALAADLLRWRVGPLDRFRAGERRSVFLVLRPTGPCRAGATLWAEISLNGSWLAAEERGSRTLGGVLADCNEPTLLIEVVSVEQRGLMQ
jgi:hypothetical protein